MAKKISYQYLVSEINHGTEENPDIEQILSDKFFICSTEAAYEEMYHIAEKEAYNGKIDVEGEFDEEITEPTQLDRVEAQATYTAMVTDTLLEV